MQSSRAVTGDTPSSRESPSAGPSSHATVSQIRSAFIDAYVAHLPELLIALLEARCRIHRPHVGERPLERRIEQRRGQLVFRVGAANRLWHDLVNDPDVQQVRRGQL